MVSVAGVRAFSDPTGAYALTLPAPGPYVLDTEKAGFFAQKGVKFDAFDGENEANVTLVPVREFADKIDVQASVTALELDTTHSQETLTGTQLLNIPYPTTHNLKNAMRVIPGVVQDSRGGIHVAGGAEEQSLYLLDGFNVWGPSDG